MVLVDANVLLYAVNEEMAAHDRARLWIEESLSGDEPVGFAWVVLLAFLRVSTLPALFPSPLDIGQALELVDLWLAATPARVVAPTQRHAVVLGELLRSSGAAGNLTSDAHLAALAIEHGARICTFDGDFARFESVDHFAPPLPG